MKPQKTEREGAGARPLRAGLPPEPEMRSEGRLRKSKTNGIKPCYKLEVNRHEIVTFSYLFGKGFR